VAIILSVVVLVLIIAERLKGITVSLRHGWESAVCEAAGSGVVGGGWGWLRVTVWEKLRTRAPLWGSSMASPSVYRSYRFFLALLAGLGFANVYFMRVNLRWDAKSVSAKCKPHVRVWGKGGRGRGSGCGSCGAHRMASTLSSREKTERRRRNVSRQPGTRFLSVCASTPARPPCAPPVQFDACVAVIVLEAVYPRTRCRLVANAYHSPEGHGVLVSAAAL
jgi:hypothetical protein